jgi:hypothetical protein
MDWEAFDRINQELYYDQYNVSSFYGEDVYGGKIDEPEEGIDNIELASIYDDIQFFSISKDMSMDNNLSSILDTYKMSLLDIERKDNLDITKTKKTGAYNKPSNKKFITDEDPEFYKDVFTEQPIEVKPLPPAEIEDENNVVEMVDEEDEEDNVVEMVDEEDEDNVIELVDEEDSEIIGEDNVMMMDESELIGDNVYSILNELNNIIEKY